MDTLTCIKTRRSIRRYTKDPIPQETVRAIADHFRFAPSWSNTKVPRLFYVSDRDLMAKMTECFPPHNQWIIDAAGFFVLTAVTGRAGIERHGSGGWKNYEPQEWMMFDCGIAAQTLCLAAWDYGVGTVIMGGYRLDDLSACLPIPEGEKLVALIAAGWPNESPNVPRRNEVNKILRFIE